MEAYFVDVLNLLVRSLHIITGIAWIGASFYFVMLDSSLKAPKKSEDGKIGVFGELWAVHGGGFYHSQKYLKGPTNEPLPQDLHWSKWEAYTTWISGFFLLAIVYWYGADIYLIDASKMALSQSAAIGISIAFLVGSWVIYDFLCKSALAKSDRNLGIVIFILVAVAAYALTQIFSGRGAFMTFGAMLGTTMVANVFFVIIPGQKKMVDDLNAGVPVNPIYGQRGKQRSVHNTYFTLPVLFTMISNHYAMTYSHEYNWAILIAISMAGALIRIFFVSRHGEGKPMTWAAVAGGLIMVGVIWAMAPKSVQPITALPVASSVVGTAAVAQPVAKVSFDTVNAIIQERCTVCHAATPSYPGFAAAPKGYMYNTQAQIEAQAALIYQQTVVLKAMPIGNLTGITEEERQVIAQWYQQR
jgi:uncharacterized membrane protein